jgi:GTP pyrophosphokinase
MHDHAELGVAAHWRYKEGGKRDIHFDERVAWMRRLLEWKGEVSEAREFLEDFRGEVGRDRVYVFTPKGKIVDLPAGARPLDFAYAVHTDVGHRCRGAKVNGRIVNLTYELRSGDTVEVLTTAQGGPSRDWLLPHLGYLATPRARAKVRSWFKRQDYSQNIAAGKAALEQELHRLGIDKDKVDYERLIRRFHCQKLEEFLAAIGRGDVSTVTLADALAGPAADREEEVLSVPSSLPAFSLDKSGDVSILGVGDLLTHMGGCCKPVPGDPIIGFITRGHGVTIHRSDCLNVLNVEPDERPRLIEVEWTSSKSSTFPVDIQIRAFDRTGLIRDVTSVLGTERVNVLAMNTISDKGQNTAHMTLTIEVTHMGQLIRVLERIGQLPNILEARRKV